MILRTEPMKQQLAAVQKLKPFKVGALFMDMGTGKSLAAIMLALSRRKVRRVVWFCPITLKPTIEVEIEKHVEDASVYVFDDSTSSTHIPNAYWYVVGIESMSSSDRVRLAVKKLIDPHTMVILDESGYCANHKAERTRWITGLSRPALYRLMLTGTPIQKGIQDLFSQMFFLDERILGYKSFYSFAANHLEYHERKRGLVVRAHNVPWISAKIAPYVYQVTKAECLDLPEKLFEHHWVRMTWEQEELYSRAKETLFAELMECDDSDKESVLVYRLFNACRQAACGFWNEYPRLSGRKGDVTPTVHEAEHRRLETLESVLRQIPEDEKVIIWAEWLRDVDDIKAMIARVYGEDQASELTGRYKGKAREREVSLFRGHRRFLVGLASTGGHGYTFTEASYAGFYSLGLQYPLYVQAQDRIHRISQTKPCTYFTINMQGTIDGTLMDLMSRKQSIAEYLRENIESIKDKTTRVSALRRLMGQIKADEQKIAS